MSVFRTAVVAAALCFGCNAKPTASMDAMCREVPGHPHASACTVDIQCTHPPDCVKPYPTAGVCCTP